MEIVVEKVPNPLTPSDDPSWQILGVAQVAAECEMVLRGHADLAMTAREAVASLANQQTTLKGRLIAREVGASEVGASEAGASEGDPGAVLGYAVFGIPTRDNLTTAGMQVEVRPGSRGRGIGSALWDAVLAEVRSHGRTVLHTYVSYPVEPGEGDPSALGAPTGSGRVPGEDAATRFARSRGYVLEQVERHSELATPVAEAVVARLLAEAAAVAGSEYELVAWRRFAPPEVLDSLVVLQSAMSTDAPVGGLDRAEEAWDAERVRTLEQAVVDMGWEAVCVGARHIASGELAGYTEVWVKLDDPAVAYQENTIVRADHRGHRLGMWLKAANLQTLARDFPQVRRIHTWNAEENEHMLAINVALGFAPAGVEGAWQLRL